MNSSVAENEHLATVRKRVYERLDAGIDITDEELADIIEQCIFEESRTGIMSICQREKLKIEVFNSIRKLDVLQELLDDNTITEIMVNGYQNIFIERNGRLVKWDKCFESSSRLENLAQKIAAISNRMVNESLPIVDTRLEDGSRVNIVLPPVAMDGPVITIRKFYQMPITVEKLIEMESVTQEAAIFLEKAVKARYNIFVSGGTGSGKTTFLNALSNFIPSDERVITIEDSAELQLKDISNLVRLEARNANVEGKNAITIRDLIRSSLRMRPDRIVVGEVRGAETVDMLQAMNTGHDGSLSTGHSNSPKDMLTRMETMVLMGMDMPVDAIQQQIASAIDIIVHLGRLRDKSRKVLQIVEVLGIEHGSIMLNTLYEFKESGEDENGKVIGTLGKMEGGLVNNTKMHTAGIKEY
jgi:pilus assembly protein CpaF